MSNRMIVTIRTISTLIISLGLVLISTSSASAQVVINEFSPTEEWVELFNTGATDISLDQCVLNLGDSNQDINFGLTDVLSGSGGGKFKLVTWGSSSWLADSGDDIKLLPCSTLGGDSIKYGSGGVVSSPGNSKSAGRSPDGSNNFLVFTTITPGSPNPVPTLTPTATATATATAMSAPTATPTKTPTPVPTKSPTPKATKTPTPEPEVLGEANTSEEPKLTSEVNKDSSGAGLDSPEVSSSGKRNIFLPIIFIASGVGMIGFAVYNLVRARKNPVQN